MECVFGITWETDTPHPQPPAKSAGGLNTGTDGRGCRPVCGGGAEPAGRGQSATSTVATTQDVARSVAHRPG